MQTLNYAYDHFGNVTQCPGETFIYNALIKTVDRHLAEHLR